MIVAAHPDDEVIGTASVLLRQRSCRLIHVTDGAPRDMRDARAAGFTSRTEYAQARRAELDAALSHRRIGSVRCRQIGIVDQEAIFEVEPLIHRLVALLRHEPPASVITHAYEGGHPDHDAAALAVHVARELLHREQAAAPQIIEMTSYHAGPHGIRTGTFLESHLGTQIEWSVDPITTVQLDVSERRIKHAMLACFATQQRVLAHFNGDCERFRAAPSYCFSEAPHPGRLFYEHFAWGVDGTRWRELATRALRVFDLDPSVCH